MDVLIFWGVLCEFWMWSCCMDELLFVLFFGDWDVWDVIDFGVCVFVFVVVEELVGMVWLYFLLL